MRFLKCNFWLSAWAVWLWLGFGLYREMPQSLGPFVRRLPIETDAVALGFVGDTNKFAIQSPRRAPKFEWPNVLVMDAESGIVVGERPLPYDNSPFTMGNSRREWTARSLQFGVLLGPRIVNRRAEPDGETLELGGLDCLDLLTGDWRALSKNPRTYMAVHPSKPWVVVVEGVSSGMPDRMVVVDFLTGKELFNRSLRKEAIQTTILDPTTGRNLVVHIPTQWTDPAGDPFFLAKSDRLVLPLLTPPENGGRPSNLEVWRIANPPTLEETVKVGIGNLRPISVSASERMLFDGKVERVGETEIWVDIYDFNSRRFLTSIPPSEQMKEGNLNRSVGNYTAAISPSGRTVLRGGPANLYEVETGRVLWKARDWEDVTDTDSPNGFLVNERWWRIWHQWKLNWHLETRARRSLETGELIDRTIGQTVAESSCINSSKTLVVLPDGAVHRLPLERNWPLIILCQTIVALPLVFFWLILLWRRRRIARRLLPQAAAP